MASVRLTAPQVELLTDIATHPEYFLRRYSRWEKTGHVLHRHGFASLHSEGMTHVRIVITNAGREEAKRRGIIQ